MVPYRRESHVVFLICLAILSIVGCKKTGTVSKPSVTMSSLRATTEAGNDNDNMDAKKSKVLVRLILLGQALYEYTESRPDQLPKTLEDLGPYCGKQSLLELSSSPFDNTSVGYTLKDVLDAEKDHDVVSTYGDIRSANESICFYFIHGDEVDVAMYSTRVVVMKRADFDRELKKTYENLHAVRGQRPSP